MRSSRDCQKARSKFLCSYLCGWHCTRPWSVPVIGVHTYDDTGRHGHGVLTEWIGIVGDRPRLPKRKISVTKCAARRAKAARSASRYTIAPLLKKWRPAIVILNVCPKIFQLFLASTAELTRTWGGRARRRARGGRIHRATPRGRAALSS